MQTVTKKYEVYPELKQYKKDLKWFNSNSEILSKLYKGKYIAISNKIIVDYDTVLDILLERVKIKYSYDWHHFVIEFVY